MKQKSPLPVVIHSFGLWCITNHTIIHQRESLCHSCVPPPTTIQLLLPEAFVVVTVSVRHFFTRIHTRTLQTFVRSHYTATSTLSISLLNFLFHHQPSTIQLHTNLFNCFKANNKERPNAPPPIKFAYCNNLDTEIHWICPNILTVTGRQQWAPHPMRQQMQ